MLLISTAPHVNKYSYKAYTERKKTKRTKHKMSQIKILKDLSQGSFHTEKKD
jgi:hypothetical protein